MLEIVRKFTNDGATYFGPYVSARGLRSLISVINKAFPLRKCSDNILKSAKRPCLNYQIHTCLAPCQGYIEKKDYMGLVDGVLKVLKGKITSVIEELEKEMLLASDNLDFEEAARIRERIKILDILYSRQAVVMSGDTRDIDLITFKKNENIHVFNILLIRSGLLLGQTNVVVQGNGTDEEAMNRLLVEHYSKNMLPDLISVPFEIKDAAVIALIKTLSTNKKVQLSSKTGPEIKRIRRIGEGNLDEYIRMMNTKKSRWSNSSSELCKLLGVPANSIRTIECYDMSNTSGQFTVGAKVYFLDGVPAKDEYRKYKIKGDYKGDDLKTMQEVFLRRIEKINEEPLPDLIILDGGKTQLNAVASILKTLSLKTYRLISIAKDKSTSKGLSIDKLYYLEDGYISVLEPSKDLLNFIKMIRDEAHRFVISYHRQVRQKGFKN
ncbi:MAG: excinuclease ABC subunit UvrC [bacterium]